MSLDIYVKKEFPVEVIMEKIEGSQDDVCKTQFSLKFMSKTGTSIIAFSNDWVGPPKSVVTVVVGGGGNELIVICGIGGGGGGVVVVGGGGGGLIVVGDGGGLFVVGGGGDGLLIGVGGPAGPEQTSPSGQHPSIPLLPRTQYIL